MKSLIIHIKNNILLKLIFIDFTDFFYFFILFILILLYTKIYNER
jgi:hypothetical protein